MGKFLIENAKPRDQLLKMASIIGGFGGGIGALIAVFFLWLNFSELRKQIEYENKGFLAIKILDSENDSLQPGMMNFNYELVTESRVPLILSGGAVIGMTSKQREIDIIAWGKEEEQHLVGFYEYRIPILEDTVSEYAFELSSKHMIADSVITVNQDTVELYNFYLHILYRYRDVTDREYWGYMRWWVYLFDKEKDRSMQKKLEGHIRPEYWITWEAKSDRIRLCDLPKDLRKIQRKALSQSETKKKDKNNTVPGK
ncbi:hypothetical protein JXM67_14295 [candidate division WOR-3 bacterium]|nr:hypothetical protein [candidate division WOR-3 bacterium]